MCQRVMPRVVYLCGHEVEQAGWVLKCAEAQERDSECENPTPNYSFGKTVKKEKCPDCKAADEGDN